MEQIESCGFDGESVDRFLFVLVRVVSWIVCLPLKKRSTKSHELILTLAEAGKDQVGIPEFKPEGDDRRASG